MLAEAFVDAEYQEALDWLFSRIDYERRPSGSYTAATFKLERMAALLDELGRPHERIPVVHIAGTKGKGSTAAMTAGILQAAGYQTGLFTSPHLYRFEERMTVNGRTPSRGDVVRLVDEISEASARIEQRGPDFSPTFFELTTAMAWRFFESQHVDLAVLEVGLGGRLDATNLCRPLATIITSISRDHMHLLGESRASIAAEKAGIIKPSVPVLSGVTDREAREPIARRAKEQSAPLYEIGTEIVVSETTARGGRDNLRPARWSMSVETPWGRHESLQAPLPGEHQVSNAALAASVADLLEREGYEGASAAVRKGLAEVQWPLRIEVVGERPLTILDAAHNNASIEALIETLRPVTTGKRILVFGTSQDKDAAEMLRLLQPAFDETILTQYEGNARALPCGELAGLAAAAGLRNCCCEPSVANALDRAHSLAEPGDLICVTGSFFLAAEVRRLILDGGGVSDGHYDVSSRPVALT